MFIQMEKEDAHARDSSIRGKELQKPQLLRLGLASGYGFESTGWREKLGPQPYKSCHPWYLGVSGIYMNWSTQ